MPTSEARTLANRKNAQKSTGPKTPEGKARSRANGLKHGLTGAGIVLTEEDATEVEIRNAELQAELAPQSAMGRIMVREMALLSVRMERGAAQESAAIARNVRHAIDDFDQARLDEAETLIDILGEDPRIHRRKLRNSPEGVERLFQAWQELRDDLTRTPRPTWTAWHLERALNLTGRRIEEGQGTEWTTLSKASWGDFGAFETFENDKAIEARKAQARDSLLKRIEAEMSELTEHYETLDFETLEQDRAEAPTRALFDPSKEASLARRYESEARRGFYKALAELRRAEAEAAARPEPEATPQSTTVCDPLASSWNVPSSPVREPRPAPAPVASKPLSATLPTENRSAMVATPVPVGSSR